MASKFWYVTKRTFLNENLDETTAYPKSKALAERSIWDFIDTLPEESQLDAVSINPGFLVGPILGKNSQF